MTRLLARLVLAMLLLPISGSILVLGLVLSAATGRGEPSLLFVVCVWTTVYAFIAIYWIALWSGIIQWKPWRVSYTALAGAGAIVAAIACTAATYSGARGIPIQFAALLGGGVAPILWVLATVLIWRETPIERLERLARLGRAAVSCPICGYNMTGLSETRCPECGAKFTIEQLVSAQPHVSEHPTEV
ncbi:MAG: hypothetical protein ACREJC_21420 [Tepidisphaeraceae bacterium]